MGIWFIIGSLGSVLLIVCLSAAAAIASHNARKPLPLSDADALKFAELLVAEIKLSNLNKAEKGLGGRNLYLVFQNEIQSARGVYKSRVANPEQFKYFDQALVNVLAEGNGHYLGKGHYHDFG